MTLYSLGMVASPTISFRIHLSAQEPTLSLRLNNVYGFNSGQIGLVYIASGVPSIFGIFCHTAVCIELEAVF